MYRYHPRDVVALKLLLEADAEEEAKRAYMAQLMWLQVNGLYAFGGSSPDIPSYSDMFGRKTRKKQQSAEEIIDIIIAKAEGGGANGRSV